MAYQNLLSADAILSAAVQLVERGEADGLSLRAVAASLGVKAPSLYRYFQDKGALELAVAEEALRRMHGELEPPSAVPEPRVRLLATANAYLRFAREHYALYSYVFQGRVREAYDSSEGKAVWKMLLEAVSGLSGKPDDTASTVAIWSFLHGYATLEYAGGFGTSGPRGALELGLNAFMTHSEHTPLPPAGASRKTGRAHG